MKLSRTKLALLAAATIGFGAVPTMAQTTADGTNVTSTNDGNVETTTRTTRTEDHDFPWGLLGLLGLAGLIPRKRKEADIHVDARHDTRR